MCGDATNSRFPCLLDPQRFWSEIVQEERQPCVIPRRLSYALISSVALRTDFNPESQIFDERHWGQVLWSDFGIALAITAIVAASKQFGFLTMMAYYGIPYLAVNNWLVLITFLQHTDPMLPHYRAGEWNFVRGA